MKKMAEWTWRTLNGSTSMSIGSWFASILPSGCNWSSSTLKADRTTVRRTQSSPLHCVCSHPDVQFAVRWRARWCGRQRWRSSSAAGRRPRRFRRRPAGGFEFRATSSTRSCWRRRRRAFLYRCYLIGCTRWLLCWLKFSFNISEKE